MRIVVTSILLSVAMLAVPPGATADDCPALIRAIYAAADIRFDQRAYDARAKAVEAARLHAEGMHDDAEKVAREGCVLLGISCGPHPTR